MTLFLERIDHYLLLIDLIFLGGSISFFALARKDQKIRLYRLLLVSLVLVFVYENLAYYLASHKIPNNWVYMVFFRHFATWVNLLIIRQFLKRAVLKRVIDGQMLALLLLSGFPYLLGYIPVNDAGEFTSLLSGSFVIISCGIFFFELLTNEEFLSLDPLRFSGFWISTFMLFFYSASFMILISNAYLINHHMDVYDVVIEITRHSALALYMVYLMTLVKRKGWSRQKLEEAL